METSDILVSFIIPVYNVERYLKRCIDSVLAQTSTAYEVILVNDGSTDTSPEICEGYSACYEQIKVVHKKNGGLSDARNHGLHYAQGVYVLFLDSDDWLETQLLSDFEEKLANKAFDMLTFDREFVRKTTDPIQQPPLKTAIFTGGQAFVEMLRHQMITGFATDKFYKRTLFYDYDIAFPVGKTYEDLGTIYKLLLHSDQVFSSNQKYYHYLVSNPDSITYTWSEKKLLDMLGFYREIKQSSFVNESLSDTDLPYLQTFYVDGLVYLLSILYKEDLTKKFFGLYAQLKEDLKRNPIAWSQVWFLPNRNKYLLYRLGLLGLAFDLKRKLFGLLNKG